MRNIFYQFVLIIFIASVSVAQTTGNTSGTAQTSAGSAAGTTDSEGHEFGNYRVQQSFEFGYRFTDINGNLDVYNTFLNQHTGPRLLEQTLSTHATNGTGALFDA